MLESRHEMQLATVHPSGAEEWSCPQCGRRFVATWEPVFRRVILEQGEERAIHTGQGLSLAIDVAVDSLEKHAPKDTKLEDVWKRLLDKLDIDLGEDDDLDE